MATVEQVPHGLDLYTDYYLFAQGAYVGGSVWFPCVNMPDLPLLQVDPVAQTASLAPKDSGASDYLWGLANIVGSKAFWFPAGDYSESEQTILVLDGSTGGASVEVTNVSTSARASLAHSNGLLYSFGNVTGNDVRVSIIDPDTLTGYEVTISAGSTFYPAGAVEAADGRIFVAAGFTRVAAPAFLVFDPSSDTWSFSNLGASIVNAHWFAGAARGSDGRIFYVPGSYFDSDTQPRSIAVVDPSSNSATLGATVPHAIRRLGNGNIAPVVTGADGLIYWNGQSTADPTVPLLVAYDPATDSYTTTGYTSDTGFTPSFATLARAGSVIVGANSDADFGSYEVTDSLLYIGSAGVAAAFLFAVGSIPVDLAVGATPVTGMVG